jgi:DNA-binding NarL/FixJ family response regulator
VTPGKTIRVLLADDHDMIRGALRSLLDSEPAMRVIAAAEVGPDVVVMDLRMPGVGGAEATRRIRADTPGAKVVVLSAHTDPRIVKDALAAGALGYVVKDEAFRDLAAAVRSAHEGKLFVARDVKGVPADRAGGV